MVGPNFGKSIKIFLLDGDPTKRKICEISNWSGRVYYLPRYMVLNSDLKPELRTPGVYLLFGVDANDKEMVYIGQSNDIYKRLSEHLPKKEFWNMAIVATSSNDDLNTAKIMYLEYKMLIKAAQANKYVMDNSQSRYKNQLSRSEIHEMDEFLYYTELLVNILGYSVFDVSEPEEDEKEELLYLDMPPYGKATGQRSSEGFIVFAGSTWASTVTPKNPPWIESIRKEVLDSEPEIIRNNSLSKNYVFRNPTHAASAVCGTLINGYQQWKTKTGQTLKEYEISQLGNN